MHRSLFVLPRWHNRRDMVRECHTSQSNALGSKNNCGDMSLQQWNWNSGKKLWMYHMVVLKAYLFQEILSVKYTTIMSLSCVVKCQLCINYDTFRNCYFESNASPEWRISFGRKNNLMKYAQMRIWLGEKAILIYFGLYQKRQWFFCHLVLRY